LRLVRNYMNLFGFKISESCTKSNRYFYGYFKLKDNINNEAI
jgi:hypothetical protein